MQLRLTETQYRILGVHFSFKFRSFLVVPNILILKLKNWITLRNLYLKLHLLVLLPSSQ